MSGNPESILDSVKQVLGLDADQTEFDVDVTMHINTAFMSLQQLGVGPTTGFAVADNSLLWSDYTPNIVLLAGIKSYLYLKVRMMFDPPATSFVIAAMEKQISELEWRLNVMAETISPPSVPFIYPSHEYFGGDLDWGLGYGWGWGDPIVVQYVPIVVDLAFASQVGIDASKGNVFNLMLTADCVVSAPSNGKNGDHITLQVISNGHAITWGAGWNFGSAGLPALSSGGETDIISAVYNATSNVWYAGITSGF